MSAPTRSQIEGWDTEHLENAARSWKATAEEWEDTFTAVHRGSLNPGGTEWEGEAAEAAQQRTFADLVKVRNLSDHLVAAANIARRGADQLDYLKRMALDAVDEARAAGFTVGEDLSLSDRSLVPLGPAFAARQAEAQTLAAQIHLRAAALSAADHEIAANLTAATTPLSGVAFEETPAADSPSTVQAVDYKTAPPPDPAYPVNDVIAEATDLDGNHVVLRRGYYNAVTKEGFGWDKIYWKHGLINSNVVNDLISHSHPKENQGGTLVYEVPINRAHCTSGFLGLPSCTDTGESLTMRIVANTNPSYNVPGGGQKGIITMYPLPGGSGVVEVQPNWTLTPPWVNNNAPIN
jgi:hypothetical protein